MLAAGVIGAGMILVNERRALLDAPLTSVGLLAGVATFAVLEIVLSVPMWVGVVSALGTIGLYDLARMNLIAAGSTLDHGRATGRTSHAPAGGNGHGHYDGEPVATR